MIEIITGAKQRIVDALLHYYNEHKKFPSRIWLCNYTKLSLEEVNAEIEALKKEGVISKYQTNWYVKKSFLEHSERQQPAINQMLKKITGVKISLSWLIRVACLLVGGAAIYVTSSLSYDWNCIMFGDKIKALIVSIIVPLFSSFSIEGALLLFKEKSKLGGVAGAVLIIMMIFAMLFDASAIIMAQYNKRFLSIEEKNKTEIKINKENKKYELSETQQRKQEKIVSELEIKRDEEKSKLALLSEKDKNYYTQKWYLQVAENNLKEARDKLDKKTTELKNQVDATSLGELKKKDSYAFLASKLSFTEDTFEFIIFLVVAIFLVLIAPFLIFVALGVWKK